jgi:hypothetical protein
MQNTRARALRSAREIGTAKPPWFVRRGRLQPLTAALTFLFRASFFPTRLLYYKTLPSIKASRAAAHRGSSQDGAKKVVTTLALWREIWYTSGFKLRDAMDLSGWKIWDR